MEKRFPREIAALDDIFSFVKSFVSASGLDGSAAFPIDLVAEELFTNFVRHNTDGKESILIRLEWDEHHLTITMTDFDVPKFDVTRAPAVDTSGGIAERRPGGLGIHFVREIADELAYDYTDGNSTITVRKRLEP